MTERQEGLMKFLRDELAKRLVGWAALAFIGLLAYVLTPVGQKVASIWQMPDVVAEINRDLQDIRYELAIQKRVVVWSPATRMATDCARGEECLLIARFRREEDAVACRIIPSTANFTFMSYADFVPRQVEVLQRRPKNANDEFATTEIMLVTPRAAPTGPGELRVTTSYTNCPWQVDGEPPAIAISPPIPIDITD